MEHRERLVHCLSWYQNAGDEQEMQFNSAPESLDSPEPAASGDLQHNGMKVALDPVRKDFMIRASGKLGVGNITAMHLLLNYPKTRNVGRAVSLEDLIGWYVLERQAACMCVLELALGGNDRESCPSLMSEQTTSKSTDPRGRCCQVQARFMQQNGTSLVKSMLCAFCPTTNAAQWWDTVHTVSRASSSLLDAATSITSSESNSRVLLPDSPPHERVPVVLNEMLISLQAMFGVLFGSLQHDGGDIATADSNMLNQPDRQPMLISIIQVLNLTVWGSGRLSLTQLISAANDAHVAELSGRIRQLASLVVLLAVDGVKPSMSRVYEINTSIEALDGANHSRQPHGILRMAWALRLVRMHAELPGETHNAESAALWQMIEKHWAAAERLSAFASLKELCSGKGVASGNSSDVSQRLFPSIVVAYKVLAHPWASVSVL